MSINKQKYMLRMQMILIPTSLILYSAVVNMGWGIIGVAWSTSFVYVCYGCGYLFFAAYYVFEQRKDVLGFFAEIFGIFIVMIVGLTFAVYIIPEGATLGMAAFWIALRLTLFSIVLFPVLWWFNRKGEVMAILREVLISRLQPIRIKG